MNGGSGSGGGNLGTGGGLDINQGKGTGMSDDPRDLPVREQVCVDGACTCLRLALLGSLASSADNANTQPFVDWLNNNSDGTATVTMVTEKPVLNAEWLANFDILLIANTNAWTFTEEEKAAVATWSQEAGGGIIAITGFDSEPNESAAASQLLGFAGLGFAGTDLAQATAPPSGEGYPVYYKGGSVDLKQCMVSTNMNEEAFITTPIKFTPQTDTLEDLTFQLDYVGAFYGWEVTSSAPEAVVVATDPVTGKNMAVAHEVGGKGRVFAFGDEWVSLANQWVRTGQPNNQNMDSGNICWVPPTDTEAGFFHSVQSLYQTKQFWYNAINWVAPPNECNFVVQDVDVVIR